MARRPTRTTPRIYFCRYPSGVGYWRVRRPTRINSPNHVAHMKAAYDFVARLNAQLEQPQ